LIGTVDPSVRVEWRLTDNFMIRGITEPRFGGDLTFAEGAATAVERSIGLFLFYGWSY
jgi:hypothetical protein